MNWVAGGTNIFARLHTRAIFMFDQHNDNLATSSRLFDLNENERAIDFGSAKNVKLITSSRRRNNCTSKNVCTKPINVVFSVPFGFSQRNISTENNFLNFALTRNELFHLHLVYYNQIK